MPLTDIKHGFEGAYEKAGIADTWFHDLRHTAATRMAERGVDAFTIATIIGNTDLWQPAIRTRRQAPSELLCRRESGRALKVGHKRATNKISDQAGRYRVMINLWKDG